jgi:hypothetical protein
MPDQASENRDLTEEEEAQAALEQFFSEEKKVRERKEAATAGLDEALAAITATIAEHWGSGSGRRWRQIVWSIYNGSHLVGLGDVLTNFDTDNGLLVSKLIDAKLAGALDDAKLKRVLEKSGEFARYEEAARGTPEDEEVIYPPLPVSAERLRELADAAANVDRRYEASRRAEDERFARLEEVG